jgi:hypothetical protein
MDCQNKRENAGNRLLMDTVPEIVFSLPSASLRPETSAGITRQIVERDEAKLDLRDALQHLAAGDRDQLQPRRAVI